MPLCVFPGFSPGLSFFPAVGGTGLCACPDPGVLPNARPPLRRIERNIATFLFKLRFVAHDTIKTLVLPYAPDTPAMALQLPCRKRFPRMKRFLKAAARARLDERVDMIVHHDECMQLIAHAIEVPKHRANEGAFIRTQCPLISPQAPGDEVNGARLPPMRKFPSVVRDARHGGLAHQVLRFHRHPPSEGDDCGTRATVRASLWGEKRDVKRRLQFFLPKYRSSSGAGTPLALAIAAYTSAAGVLKRRSSGSRRSTP